MPDAVVQLTDPRALRAVAHPTRLKLLALLRRVGPLTATQAGHRINESPAGCSFHLRQLAKWGLVEEAGGGRGRARPWRATAMGHEWAARGPRGEPDEASDMLTRVVVERWFDESLNWVERRREETEEWSEAARARRPHGLHDARRARRPEQADRQDARALRPADHRPRLPPGRRRVPSPSSSLASRSTKTSRRPNRTDAPPRPSAAALNRPFRDYWTGQTISLFGDQIALLGDPAARRPHSARERRADGLPRRGRAGAEPLLRLPLRRLGRPPPQPPRAPDCRRPRPRRAPAGSARGRRSSAS